MGSENSLNQVQITSCSFGLSCHKQDDPVTIEGNGHKHVIWLTMQWLIAIQESNYFTIQNTSFRTLSWSSMRYMYSTKFDSFQNDKSFQSDKRANRKVCDGNSFSSMGRGPPSCTECTHQPSLTGQLFHQCCLPDRHCHTTHCSERPGLPNSKTSKIM